MRFFDSLLLAPLMGASCAAQADVSLRTELGTGHYHAVERSPAGAVINTESGSLPLLTVGARWRQAPWFAEMEATSGANTIAYDGFTQLGLPLQTQTRLHLGQWAAWAGYALADTAAGQFSVVAGLAQQRLDRDILPGLGSLPLRETLDTTRLVAGVRWRSPSLQAFGRPVALNAAFDALPALRSRLAVDSYGLYDPVTLAPGRGIDWHLQLRGDIQVTPQASLWLGLGYQSFKPGASATAIWTRNGVPAVTVRYPGSKQVLRTVTVGAEWRF